MQVCASLKWLVILPRHCSRAVVRQAAPKSTRRSIPERHSLGAEGGAVSRKRWSLGVAIAATALASIVLATWSSGAGSATKLRVGYAYKAQAVSKCGLGNGKKATGAPIKLGGIDMLIPGVDFTTIGKVAAAYFKCVNDNGGINGR